MSRRRRRLRAPVLALIGLLVLLAWAAVTALLARNHLLESRSGVTALTSGSVDGDDVAARLAASEERARAAQRLLEQPGPRLVELVPVLGRSLHAERVTAEAAAEVLDAAGRLLPQLDEVAVSADVVDVGRLRDLEADLRAAALRTGPALEALREADLGLTPGPVQRAVVEAREQLGSVDDTLQQSSAGAGALAGLLGADRPRTLVVAIMNNAELRGAGGYSSSIAVVTADGGRVTVGPFQDVNAFEDKPPDVRKVPAPADFTARYGTFLADTTLWKNVLMSPHVPASASVLCEAARLTPGVPCDGVVLLDVPALARLTDVAGPTQLPGGEQLQGEELVRALLVDAYAAVENDQQVARRAALRAAADATLSDLVGRRLGTYSTLRVLAEAAAGRHLALWSADPDEQAALDLAGLAGSADPQGDDLLMFAQNQFSEGKLDYYVDRDVTVDVVVGADSAVVTQSVRLRLDMPDGLGTYVSGTRGDRLTGLGEFGLSAAASLQTVLRDGEPVRHDLVPDTGGQRVEVVVDVANRSSATWTVEYVVPLQDDTYRARLIPQPLARDAGLEVTVRPAEGVELSEVVEIQEPFTAERTLEVKVRQPSWWEREVLIN